MKFSEAFVCSKRLSNFSPDGKLIAGANNQEIYVISADSLRPIHSFKFGEKIDYIEWSPDSLYLLCASFNAAVVRVFSIENPTWKCKISEGTAGLVSVCWSPDSRHILTTAAFHIQISVWSLVDETVSYVHYVKEGKPGMAFSPDGSYLAILERRETKDHILILSCSVWTPFLRLECAGLINVYGLAWYPDNSGIAVWETPPDEGLKILWLEGGSEEGLPISKTPKTLGVRSIVWSPSAQFLAFGANDGNIHILNSITWKPISKFFHAEVVSDHDCYIYQESLESSSSKEKPKFEMIEKRPVRLTKSTKTTKTPFGVVIAPRGVRRLSFCPSGGWIASQDDSCPSALWIWSIPYLKLKAVIIMDNTIADFAWSPNGDGTLAFCSSTAYVSFWTPRSEAVILGTEVSEVSKVKWHPSGDSLLFLSKEEAILCITNDLEKSTSTKR